MRFPGTRAVARVLIALMMATFLSPSFGWHMHAGHHEIVAETHSSGHHHDDGDHHSGTDGESDAHASIGHLLGHLPMQMSEFAFLLPTLEGVAPDEEVSSPLVASESSPPYRPPLHTRLA